MLRHQSRIPTTRWSSSPLPAGPKLSPIKMLRAVSHRIRPGAFSLVEVIIAVGIFTFCIVSIVYLLGSALNSSRQSQMDSAMTAILRNAESELRAVPSANLAAMTGVSSYYDVGGNLATNTNSRAFLAVVTRVAPASVASMTSVTNGANISAGITNTTNNYLWVLKVSYPPPNYPLTNNLILGRTLMGSGSWTIGTNVASFNE